MIIVNSLINTNEYRVEVTDDEICINPRYVWNKKIR